MVSTYKKEAVSSICFGEVINLKMLQSDWLRAFWSNLQKKISQIWDLFWNTKNNIKIHYRTNSVKSIEKRPYFWPISPNFGGKKSFSKISSSIMHNFIRVSSSMSKFKKKRSNSKEATTQMEWQAEGQKDRPYFKRPFWLLLRVQQVPLQYTNSLLRYSRFEDPMN